MTEKTDKAEVRFALRTVYFTMVEWPRGTVRRVGNAYPSESSATAWLSFVSGAHGGGRSFVEPFTVVLVDGVPDAETSRVLLERYNLDSA